MTIENAETGRAERYKSPLIDYKLLAKNPLQMDEWLLKDYRNIPEVLASNSVRLGTEQNLATFAINSGSILAQKIIKLTHHQLEEIRGDDQRKAKDQEKTPNYHLYLVPINDSQKGMGYVPIIWFENSNEEIPTSQVSKPNLVDRQIHNLQNPIFEKELFTQTLQQYPDFMSKFEELAADNLIDYFQKEENSNKIMVGLLNIFNKLLNLRNDQEPDSSQSNKKELVEIFDQRLKFWLDFASYLQRNNLLDPDVFRQLSSHDKYSQVLIDTLNGYGKAQASRIIPHLTAENLDWYDFIDYIDDLSNTLTEHLALNPSYEWLKSRLGEELMKSLLEPHLSKINWKHFTDKDKNENLGKLIEGEIREIMQFLQIMDEYPEDKDLLKETEELIIVRLSRLYPLPSKLSDIGICQDYRFAVGEESSPKTIIEHIDEIIQRMKENSEKKVQAEYPFLKLASGTNIVKPGTLLSTAIKQARIKLLRESEIPSLSPKRPTEDAALEKILSENNSEEDYLFFVSPKLRGYMSEDEWIKYKENILGVLSVLNKSGLLDTKGVDLSKIDPDKDYFVIKFDSNQNVQLVKKLAGQAHGQKEFMDAIIENYDRIKEGSIKEGGANATIFVGNFNHEKRALTSLLKLLGIESDVHVSDSKKSGGSLYIFIN